MEKEDLQEIEERVKYINHKVTALCVWKDEFEKRYESDMRWIKCMLKAIVIILSVLLGLVTYL